MQAAGEETRAFIEKLKADHPDGSGLLGGMIVMVKTSELLGEFKSERFKFNAPESI